MRPLLLLLALGACSAPQDDFDPDAWPLGEVVAVEGTGILAELDTVQGPVQVLRVQGTHAEMGRQLGVLVGDQVGPVWDNLTAALAEELDMDPGSVETLYGPLLDTAWEHMKPHSPPEWVELLEAAHAEVGGDTCDLCRVLVLSNISDLNFDSITDAMGTLGDGRSEQLATFYAEGPDAAAMMDAPPPMDPIPSPFGTCSFFAAWGERTADGHLIASRNLDWNSDTGIAANKAITIYLPEGGQPFATLGYAGMIGALAGMSSHGIAVAEVGSTGVLERLAAEPWVLRNLEILEQAADLDQGLAYHTNTVDDGLNRPQSIGYNLMVAWGDPEGAGASAEAATIEANGAMASVLRGGHTQVHLFDEQGWPHEVVDGNDEAGALEIDRMAAARRFACDEDGVLLTDEGGDYYENPEGCEISTGLPLSQALFRGDEAMSHHNRRFQLASHGPQGSDGLLITSGSYKNRYKLSHDLLAGWEGTTPVGLDQGVELAVAAAMSSNVLSVVYDATDLTVRVSWEQGTGEDWVPASELEYIHVDLMPAFEF